MKNKPVFYLILILIFAWTSSLFFSCEKDPPRLTREHQAQIDTLVKLQTILLRTELDSLCNVDFDKKVESATDSLVKVRIEDINRQFR